MKTAIVPFLFALSTLSLTHAWAMEDSRTTKLTDLAALNIQDRSITKLQSLVKQYRGTSREPELLSRLADLYIQRSGITFRISEGTSVKKKNGLYTSSLKDSIRVYTELLQRYPYHISAANAHFKRGKAYKELEEIKEARADFLFIDQNYKDFDYLDSALIDLTDFAQDANAHQEALTYLSKIEKMGTASDYYSVALHKAAWSYYNLGLHQSSLDYLKKEIDFYFDKIEAKEASNSKTNTTQQNMGAENAFLDSAFNDLALFSFEAFNKKASFAKIDKTLDFFTSLDRNHKFFGPTILKFARLLKAYSLIPELDELKNKLIKNYIQIPETSEVALLMFQFYFDRREFNALSPLIADLNKIRSSVKNKSLDQKVESTLSNALSELHKMVIKNKNATEIATLVRPLISLTESVSDLLGDDNATSLLANYSLAETSFELEDYPRATQKYLELLNPKYTAILEGKKLSHHSLALRLLASRYRELKKEQLIPEKLSVRALNSKVSAASKDQLVKMNEWISWVDQHVLTVNAQTPVEEKQSFDAFSLEANKLMYEYVDETAALNRLEKFAFLHPENEEGQTSISIVLDTLSKSEEWTRIYTLGQKILTIKTWKDKNFISRVNEMNADSHLRITLKTEQPELILSRTEECLEKYKSLKIAQECLIIHAKTELKLNQNEKAEKELTKLLSQLSLPTDHAKIESILLLRADARNKIGQMDEAMADLYQYQSMTDFKDAEVTQSILQHYWFKHDHVKLEALIKNGKVCSGKNEEICEQFKVVRILDEGRDSKQNYSSVFRNTIKASKNLTSVWALIALREPKKLPFQDRLILLQRLASSWEQVNPLLQIHLFPTLQTRVKDTLESIRISAPGIAPLSADTASIERRMRLMQDIDLTFAKVMKLNWLDIKLKGASELGMIYTRLVQDLRGIQTPEALLKPFLKKNEEIASAIQSLQEMGMQFNPNRSVAGVTTEAKTTSANISSDPILDLLLSPEMHAAIPAHLWTEWKNGVMAKRRDYLFYLVSIVEATRPDFKLSSGIVKGLILLTGNAPTEAYELIKAAAESPWKASVASKFVSSGAAPAGGTKP